MKTVKKACDLKSNDHVKNQSVCAILICYVMYQSKYPNKFKKNCRKSFLNPPRNIIENLGGKILFIQAENVETLTFN